MNKNNLIRFVQSLVILPVMSMPIVFSDIHSTGISQNVLVQKVNMEASGTLAIKDAMDQKLEAQKIKADAIDAYFRSYDMPLFGQGLKMVQEAEKNQLDWRLLPAIAVRESTGGKNACDYAKNNPFGWGSCKIGFKSTEEAIETVARNLGGNNPNTASRYDNKTVEQILRVYNPPSIIPKYAEQVIKIMNDIGDADEAVVTPSITT